MVRFSGCQVSIYKICEEGLAIAYIERVCGIGYRVEVCDLVLHLAAGNEHIRLILEGGVRGHDGLCGGSQDDGGRSQQDSHPIEHGSRRWQRGMDVRYAAMRNSWALALDKSLRGHVGDGQRREVRVY